ncbi:MAG: sigma-54-dependent Fis family transcriptional regulator [Caldisericaceae bacterium]|nr:sigma-54-dependent Fis family transcriptional regulator [Caldisericaceae bacterium]
MENKKLKPYLLVIDDDETHREGMALLLEDEDYQVDQADSAESAMELIRRNSYDLIITDYKMKKIDGMELLKMINDYDPLLKVIMVTGYGSIEHAVEALRLGAFDYMPKPIDPVKLKEVVRRALKVQGWKQPEREAIPLHFGEIVGQSRPIKQVVQKIRKIANIDVPVLIYGESGTGKELVARAIHQASDRRGGPFIAVNTGAIPKDLIVSELFGHEKGAFTGATEARKGKFEEADGGTLFLDEISTMDEATQIALLRVLETHQIERVGSSRSLEVNVRIVAASNKDLKEFIEEGRFREDLYYRLNVYRIDLPPLNERTGDVPMLVEYFIRQFNAKYNMQIASIDSQALEILQNYAWPGNVRELRNVVLNAMIQAKDRIQIKDLPPFVLKPGPQEIRFRAGMSLPDIERLTIVKTLKMVGGNKLKAAELLGISRKSLYNKLEDYQIKDEEYQSD